MAIEYLYQEGVEACSIEPLKVRIDGDHAGEIRRVKEGYRYFSYKNQSMSPVYLNVQSVQNWLKESYLESVNV